jgi:hypothetical protein
MFNHFHIEAHNHHNSKDDHNLLPIPHDVVTTTQLQNYKNLCNTIKQGDVWRTFSKGIIPELTRLCHSMPKRVRMTPNHFALSHTRLVTLKSTKFVPRARNKTLPNPTTLNNSGIQIHERLVSQFFTTFINGV